MSDRRTFLRGLASLPLVGGSVALIGSPVRAAVPVTTTLLEHYSDWLAAEHGETLIELAALRMPEHAALAASVRREWCRENLTLNPSAAAEAFLAPPDALPSTRAAVVLSAAGVPLGSMRREIAS